VECPPDKLCPLRLATSAPRQGERVAAFGSPLGLQQSVSEGIVSAVRESKELRPLGPIDVNALLIQTTAPVSHGNSGGPLVDMKGMVVGVNTMTFRFLGGENVNFAVAAADVKSVLGLNHKALPLPVGVVGQSTASKARRILDQAHAHRGVHEYDKAIADYTVAIRLAPKKREAYWGRGQAYFYKDDFDSAIADYTEAIRLDPTWADVYYARSWAYRAKGQRTAAERDDAHALKLELEP
jgi:tetratricopeptide (TPR) repeat protein